MCMLCTVCTVALFLNTIRDFERFRAISGDFERFRTTSNDFERLRTTSNDFRRLHLEQIARSRAQTKFQSLNAAMVRCSGDFESLAGRFFGEHLKRLTLALVPGESADRRTEWPAGGSAMVDAGWLLLAENFRTLRCSQGTIYKTLFFFSKIHHLN